MASPRLAAVLCVVLVVASALVGPARRAGAQSVSGTAMVNDGNGVSATTAGIIKPSGSGLSLAGAKVFNPVAQNYKISDATMVSRNPNPNAGSIEEANMEAMMGVVANLVNINKNKRNATLAARANNLLTKDGKDFNEIDKTTQILVATTLAEKNGNNATGLEMATAVARQDAVTKPKTVSTKGTMVSATAVAGANIANPVAGAYAVNIDPSPIAWDSPSSNRTVTIDLSSVKLTASSTGLGSTAASALEMVGGFVNGTDNVTTPVDSSNPLFTLGLGLTSQDGTSATASTGLSFLGFDSSADPGSLAISDSMGGFGLTQVFADMTSDFVSQGAGTFGFTLPFAITMNVPGTSDDTLLFLDEAEGAFTAVPEPSSLALCGLGAVALAGYARRRRPARA